MMYKLPRSRQWFQNGFHMMGLFDGRALLLIISSVSCKVGLFEGVYLWESLSAKFYGMI